MFNPSAITGHGAMDFAGSSVIARCHSRCPPPAHHHHGRRSPRGHDDRRSPAPGKRRTSEHPFHQMRAPRVPTDAHLVRPLRASLHVDGSPSSPAGRSAALVLRALSRLSRRGAAPTGPPQVVMTADGHGESLPVSLRVPRAATGSGTCTIFDGAHSEMFVDGRWARRRSNYPPGLDGER